MDLGEISEYSGVGALCVLGRPNLQEVPESLLSWARLRTFSKLF